MTFRATNYLKQKKGKLKANIESEKSNTISLSAIDSIKARKAKKQTGDVQKEENINDETTSQSIDLTNKTSNILVNNQSTHEKIDDINNNSLGPLVNTSESNPQVISSSNEQPVKDTPKTTGHKEQVLVPSWRQRFVSKSYKLEGTENLNDDFYLKRHQKPENEEKQIKKWDIRRQRDELIKRKLLKGRGGLTTVPATQTKVNHQQDFPPDQIYIRPLDKVSLEGKNNWIVI